MRHSAAIGANLSNNGYAFSYGGGVRAGIEYDVSSSLRLAVAGTSRIYMTNFDIYKGLFAGGGNFDIPASITAGVSYDVRPSVTVMFDYKHIFYSDVASIANPSTNQTAFWFGQRSWFRLARYQRVQVWRGLALQPLVDIPGWLFL